MENYKLTIEDGVITWIERVDENGNPIEGVLYIPKEAIAFHPDAWIFLGCNADGIEVDEKNPVFSSAHNCLLSKDGKTLIKVCKNSDVSKLTDLEIIGRDAFNDLNEECEEFTFRIPDGVTVLDYRAFAVNSCKVHLTVPYSVRKIRALAFMNFSEETHITFEGDVELEIGAFGTEAEAEDSDYEVYKSMPSAVYSKTERLTVSCPTGSNVYRYCKEYGINVSEKTTN